jgi:lipoprotein-releasing system ATP-binding protein
MIRVSGIHKTFLIGNNEVQVLKGIDLEVKKGELLCIVGASGVGKSTLLHLLGALDRPTSGKIYFEDLDLFQLKDNQMAEFRNRRIGFVFQFHHLLPEFTAIENCIMPALIQGKNKHNSIKRGMKLLGDVGLEKRLGHKPGELSGGEQQRVAVVRALMLSPDLVLADEPTGNLDTHTSDELFALIKALNRDTGVTVIMVTHNEKLAAQADRIIKMVDGQIEK